MQYTRVAKNNTRRIHFRNVQYLPATVGSSEQCYQASHGSLRRVVAHFEISKSFRRGFPLLLLCHCFACAKYQVMKLNTPRSAFSLSCCLIS